MRAIYVLCMASPQVHSHLDCLQAGPRRSFYVRAVSQLRGDARKHFGVLSSVLTSLRSILIRLFSGVGEGSRCLNRVTADKKIAFFADGLAAARSSASQRSGTSDLLPLPDFRLNFSGGRRFEISFLYGSL